MARSASKPISLSSRPLATRLHWVSGPGLAHANVQPAGHGCRPSAGQTKSLLHGHSWNQEAYRPGIPSEHCSPVDNDPVPYWMQGTICGPFQYICSIFRRNAGRPQAGLDPAAGISLACSHPTSALSNWPPQIPASPLPLPALGVSARLMLNGRCHRYRRSYQAGSGGRSLHGSAFPEQSQPYVYSASSIPKVCPCRSCSSCASA